MSSHRCCTGLHVSYNLIFILLLLAAVPSSAETWCVPSEHPYIFGAVDSASYGDTVLVEPGTYHRERDKEIPGGAIIWIEMKDGITLMSEAGPLATTLVETAPDMLNTTIHCDSIVDAVIQGFTIMVGGPASGDNWDTGIRLICTDMIVEGNVIHNFNNEAILVLWESPIRILLSSGTTRSMTVWLVSMYTMSGLGTLPV